jgi:hypothetical protein
MLSIRTSSLPDYPRCPRRFVVRFIQAAGLLERFGLRVRRLNVPIGTEVGSSLHEGAKYLWLEMKATGEHGSRRRRATAVDLAQTYFATVVGELKELGRRFLYDDTTPSNVAANQAVEKLVGQLFDDVKPTSSPELVEKGLSAIFDENTERPFKVTGTVDLFLFERWLRDWKSGRARPFPLVSVGMYVTLLRSNGFPVARASFDWLRRVASKTPQPSIQSFELPLHEAEAEAYRVARRAADDLELAMSTGSVEHVHANTIDTLCDPRFCPAFGTDACRLGELAKGTL